MRHLWCALRGHKIDYFRSEPLGVTSLQYHCDCGQDRVSRKSADALLDEFFDGFAA